MAAKREKAIQVGWRQLEERLSHLREHVPELFEEPRTVLYVGAMPRQHQCVPELMGVGCEITLIELVDDNVDFYRETDLFDHLVEGDVREVEQYFEPESFGVAFWWHGPEHVEREDVEPTVRKLEGIAKALVILASPWGKTRHYEFDMEGREHYCALYVDDYEKMGYETATLGEPDRWREGTQLLAWKWL